MPRTKAKATKRSSNNTARSATAPTVRKAADVLTLAEAAAYLRVPEADVLRMVREQGLEARQVRREWRFLKTALQEWLRYSLPKAGKEAVLSRIGGWEGDPFLEGELKNIYQRRGRSMTEEES